MSKLKCTPGPWSGPLPEETKKSGYGVYKEEDSNTTLLLGDFAKRENAVLAAIAPELLDALERLRDVAGHFTKDSLAAALDQANEIIVKAKGESV